MNKVEGESAKDFIVISLASMEQINKGELVSANAETGEVTYKDTPETTKSLTLGDHAIRIIPKHRRFS